MITDRQRASANGFLLAPGVQRNFHALQHLLPQFEFVPKSALLKYRNISPNQFGINKLVRNVDAPNNQYPVWTLFSDSGVQSSRQPKPRPRPRRHPTNTSGTSQVAASTSTGSTSATPRQPRSHHDRDGTTTASPSATLEHEHWHRNPTASTGSTQADNGTTSGSSTPEQLERTRALRAHSSTTSALEHRPARRAAPQADHEHRKLLDHTEQLVRADHGSGDRRTPAQREPPEPPRATGTTGTTGSTGSTGKHRKHGEPPEAPEPRDDVSPPRWSSGTTTQPAGSSQGEPAGLVASRITAFEPRPPPQADRCQSQRRDRPDSSQGEAVSQQGSLRASASRLGRPSRGSTGIVRAPTPAES